MGTVGRQADALGIYLTGADSDGGTQSDPDSSLGNYRSSTDVRRIGAKISDPIAPVKIERVQGINDEGDGSIRASGDSLYYTPPGGAEGTGVTVANGETKILAGNDTKKIVKVSRDMAINMTGTMTLSLVDVFNNILGMDNVTDEERVAGVTSYRALMFRAHGDYGVLDIRAWLGSVGQATYAIALEEADSDGKIQTIANDSTAPSGLSFSSPTTKSGAVHIGTLDISKNYGLWIRRVLSGGENQNVEEHVTLNLAFWGAD